MSNVRLEKSFKQCLSSPFEQNMNVHNLGTAVAGKFINFCILFLVLIYIFLNVSPFTESF